MRGPLLALFILASSSLHAAEPKASDPVKPAAFKFPAAAQTPSTPPQPAPVPGAVPKLASDTLYVIPSDEPFLLFAEPAGLVTITRETGPLKIRGKFLDGDGKIETRTYSAKHIAIVEAAGTGRVGLIAVPLGITAEKDAIRQTIDANHGAQPPPKDEQKIEPAPAPKPVPPPVPPDPKPDPKPLPVAGPLWLILVDEAGERTLATANVANATAFWQRMAGQNVKFRIYDKDESSAVRNGYVREAEKIGLPALLVLDGDGDVVKAIKAPKDLAAVESLVKELRQ